MSGEINKIPYREGEPPPGPGYIRVQMVDENGCNNGIWWLLPSDLKNAPLRQANVDSLLPMLRWTWKHMRQYIFWCRSFEEWELGFIRETNPGPEVAIWVRNTYAYLNFIHQYPSVNKAAIFGDITRITNGQECNIEPESAAKKLKQLLSHPPEMLARQESFTKDGRLKTKEKHLQ